MTPALTNDLRIELAHGQQRIDHRKTHAPLQRKVIRVRRRQRAGRRVKAVDRRHQ
jgi:hypothetical protein